MLPEKIYLVDKWQRLTSSWTQAFAQCELVEVASDDFFARDADALVSPANSFGVMDGGLDRAIRDALGSVVPSRVQGMILERHHGEMPVGTAMVVPTENARWPYLIVAPTMRVPESVANTLNAYLAFRATLLAVRSFNAEGLRIRTIVVPGLCTGIGGMDAGKCALQMRLAYDQVAQPARIPSFDRIHKIHQKLRSGL